MLSSLMSAHLRMFLETGGLTNKVRQQHQHNVNLTFNLKLSTPITCSTIIIPLPCKPHILTARCIDVPEGVPKVASASPQWQIKSKTHRFPRVRVSFMANADPFS
jgi:hypothetical protein